MKKYNLSKIKCLLEEIQSILVNEKGQNFLPGIRSCLQAIEIPDGVEKVRVTYRHMLQVGYGGFSDFYIARENFDEQKKMNQNLQKIKEELWNELYLSDE